MIQCAGADPARSASRRHGCAEAHHRWNGAGRGQRWGRDRQAEVPVSALSPRRVRPFLGEVGAWGRAARAGDRGAGLSGISCAA